MPRPPDPPPPAPPAGDGEASRGAHRRRPRRPSPRTAALAVAALAAAGTLGAGLLRAAGPGGAPGGTAAGPGVPGHCAGAALPTRRALRGMWLTTVSNRDFPSRPGLTPQQVRAEYDGWVELARRRGHNAIFVHVRPTGDAFWPSPYAPWSSWLTGRHDGAGPGWDPMAYLVERAHAAGLEFHAWFNPFNGGRTAPGGPATDPRRLAPGNPLRAHPDWAVVHPRGATGRLWIDPGVPDARRHVQDAILDAAGRYDVDGVHFDDFFYPYPVAGQDFADDASYARFGRGFADRAAWRRHNIDVFVRDTAQRLRALKPWVRFGISPFGIWRNADTDPRGSATRGLQSYDAIHADTLRWIREGWLDYVVPQLYWPIGFRVADYGVLLPWWARQVRGTGVRLYVGLADYRVGEPGPWRDPDLLRRQLELAARHGAQGAVHFSARHVRADRLGAVTRYAAAEGGPVLPPPAPRATGPAPGAPALAAARRAGAAVTLDWRPAAGPPPAGWALYRAAGGTARLVATGRGGTAPADPAGDGAGAYCVTALDRWGVEGPPSAPLDPPA